MTSVPSSLQPQLLSKGKLPAHGIRGLEGDLALKNPSPAQNPADGIVLREASSITSTIRSKSVASLSASDAAGNDAEMTMDAAAQAQFQSEWQDIQAKLAKLDAEAARRQTEIDTVKPAKKGAKKEKRGQARIKRGSN